MSKERLAKIARYILSAIQIGGSFFIFFVDKEVISIVPKIIGHIAKYPDLKYTQFFVNLYLLPLLLFLSLFFLFFGGLGMLFRKNWGSKISISGWILILFWVIFLFTSKMFCWPDQLFCHPLMN